MRNVYALKLEHLYSILSALERETQKDAPDADAEGELLEEMAKELQEAQMHHDRINQ